MPDGLVVVAGCGYVGRHLGELLIRGGSRVLGVSRSESSGAALPGAGWRMAAADISNPADCWRLAEISGPAAAVVHCASSNRGGTEEAYAAVYREGCRNLLAAFPNARFLFTSSTSVYAQVDGSWVGETDVAEPRRGTGRILREAEQRVLDSGGCVLRVAGIYGPHRSVLLRNFLTGNAAIDVRREPPLTPDGRWINQAHREDVCRAAGHVLGLEEGGFRGQIYNVCDAHPLTQRAVYRELSRRFSRPLPSERPPEEGRKRGWTNKRILNRKLCSTGWQPMYPVYFDALDRDPDLVASVVQALETWPARKNSPHFPDPES